MSKKIRRLIKICDAKKTTLDKKVISISRNARTKFFWYLILKNSRIAENFQVTEMKEHSDSTSLRNSQIEKNLKDEKFLLIAWILRIFKFKQNIQIVKSENYLERG